MRELAVFDAINEKKLREKARLIHEALIEGTVRYEQVKGKRLHQIDRAVISVPVGWRYRLVYREVGGKLTLVECCTHERYNNLIGRLR